MNDQYRASDDDWLHTETMAAHDKGNGYYALRCILELRARVRILEATQHAHIEGPLEPVPATEESSVAVPPDAEDEPQTLHSVALGMVDSLAFHEVLPEILDTLRRAIREPMEPTVAAAAPVATDAELIKAWDRRSSVLDGLRAIYNLGRKHGALAVAPSAPSAPAGGLVWQVASRVERVVDADQGLEWLALESAARGAICEVAAWLRKIGNHGSARDLEQEATRQEGQVNG